MQFLYFSFIHIFGYSNIVVVDSYKDEKRGETYFLCMERRVKLLGDGSVTLLWLCHVCGSHDHLTSNL